MNIIQTRQQNRQRIISLIAESINSKLIHGEKIQFKDFAQTISLKFACSERMAKEYLTLAMKLTETIKEKGLIVDAQKREGSNITPYENQSTLSL